jgi:hypothetical protein
VALILLELHRIENQARKAPVTEYRAGYLDAVRYMKEYIEEEVSEIQ